MKTIYKYEIKHPDYELSLPKGYDILCAKSQLDRFGDEGIFLWMLVDPDIAEVEPVKIKVFGTGMDIDDSIKLRYIDTVMMNNRRFVFHVFKVDD